MHTQFHAELIEHTHHYKWTQRRNIQAVTVISTSHEQTTEQGLQEKKEKKEMHIRESGS